MSRTAEPQGSAAQRSGTVAPSARSLRLRFDWQPNRFAWGASWAYLTGLVAAFRGSVDGMDLALALAGWFVVVPLLGSLWTDAAYGRRGRAGARERRAFPLLPVLLAISLSHLIGGAPIMVVALALPFFARGGGSGPLREALLRSVNEILIPMLFAWQVMSGPVPVPPGLALALDPWGRAMAWMRLNWLWPAIALGCSMAFLGSTIGSAMPARRVRTLIFTGYLVMIAALAVADLPVAGFLVAALLVLHWPYQTELARGRFVWYFQATQGLAMLAMLAAAAGLAFAG